MVGLLNFVVKLSINNNHIVGLVYILHKDKT